MQGDKLDYFFFFSELFNSSANLLAQGVGTSAGREGGKVGDHPKQDSAPPWTCAPKEGDVWVATLGQAGSDQFLSVPLCSWTASRGGPGTKKHLP